MNDINGMDDAAGITRLADGLLLVSLPAGAARSRTAARGAIRLALRAALARELSTSIDLIDVISSPGSAPRLVWPGGDVACSISHEDGHSFAAIYLHGPVGIDVMAVRELPDWRIVARDYLGPEVEKRLAALAPADRALAFAQAWTAREAALKCAGKALTEWTAETTTPSQNTMALVLRKGLAGAVAFSTQA
jgi:4'-phosphopantetheinyl transferase